MKEYKAPTGEEKKSPQSQLKMIYKKFSKYVIVKFVISGKEKVHSVTLPAEVGVGMRKGVLLFIFSNVPHTRVTSN